MSTIVQSLWIGECLGPIQQLSIQSFLTHGHEFHLYTYGDVTNIPEGTTVRDASTILPKESIFCYQSGFGKGSYSAFSNQFRYKLVFEKGGWWVDTDVVCLKPFDLRDDFVFVTEHEKDYATVGTFVFKSKRQSPYLEYCLRRCESKHKQELRWGEIGQELLEDAVRKFNLLGHVVPAEFFNPIPCFEFLEIVRSGFDVSRIESSYGVHLWNQMWKSNNVHPDAICNPGSLYGILKAKYFDR